MKKFFNSYAFNVILALLAAVLVIMQEIWLGNTGLAFINAFAMGSLTGIGFSWAAEVIKLLFFGGTFDWKKVLTGCVVGVVAALVTALIVI